MRHVIKKILKEDQVNLFNDDTDYVPCSHFTNTNENELCKKLDNLRSWLYSDSGLGMKNIINAKLSILAELANFNEEYQEPLKLLYQTGKYTTIKNTNGKFIDKRMENKFIVYGDDGKWHHVNKLNTNYRDLAELLTELLNRGGVVEELNNESAIGLQKYLLSIKGKLSRVLDKYFDVDDYKEFIRNTKNTSSKGEKAENYVKGVIEKFGMTILYQGGNGDFVDMLYGIDLIVSYKGKVYTIQIKNSNKEITKSIGEYRYKNIDYFSSPHNIGIVIYNKDENSFIIDRNGELVK